MHQLHSALGLFPFTFSWLEKAGVYCCTCKPHGGLNTILVSLVSVKGAEALIREGSHAMGGDLPTPWP